MQLARWLEEARAAGLYEPTACTLATAGTDGRPSARQVLLRQLDAGGLVVFTNYDSRKGRELAENPYAALVFGWQEMARQARVEGPAARLGDDESDAYFRTRPRGSQLAAWASDQSQVIADRAVLDRRYAEVATRYAEGDVPRPANWGGYRITPETVEFWQNRLDRLHDRLRYTRAADGWRLERLAP